MTTKTMAMLDVYPGGRVLDEQLLTRGIETCLECAQACTACADADLAPVLVSTKRNELIHRLLAGCCEICESTDRIEVHHLRKLADLKRHDRPDKPAWVHLMAMRRRKTLVICRPCHEEIHKGQSSASTRKRSLESRMSLT
jgi:hypothetical protein